MGIDWPRFVIFLEQYNHLWQTVGLYSVEVLLSANSSLMAVFVLTIVQPVNVSIKDTDGAKIAFDVAAWDQGLIKCGPLLLTLMSSL